MAAMQLDFYVNKMKDLHFEIGPIRPPNEGGANSLLLRITRNCPWSRCAFCYGTPYGRQPFQIRRVDEIKREIDTIKLIFNVIDDINRALGGIDWVQSFIEAHFPLGENGHALQNFQCIINVLEWIRSGARTVFLQDADSLLMKTPQLLEILAYLKAKFPSIERITSYARAKSLAIKTEEELAQLRKVGLSRLHIGLETGDDEILKLINKGITSSEHIEAAKKALRAGFEISEYVMPGIGGRSRWMRHALNTANVLNEINPTFVRFRRFVPRPGTPLFNDWKEGRFQPLKPHELLLEIKTLIEHLQVNSRICFDHFINPAYRIGRKIVHLFSQDYSGYKFPEEKEKVLDLIDYGLNIDEILWITTEELTKLPYI